MEKNKIKLFMDWDIYNTQLFTTKLMRHVQKGEIEFSYEAKKGSLITIVLIESIKLELGILISLSVDYLRQRRLRNDKLTIPQVVINEGPRVKITQININQFQ